MAAPDTKAVTAKRTANARLRYRHSLLSEVTLQEVLFAREKAGGRPSKCTLASFPACLALVRYSVKTIRKQKAWRKNMRVTYRGVTVCCSVTSFGRLLVSLPNGRRVGSSAYGAIMESD